MRVVTTITTLWDVDEMKTEHSVEISDEDGVSEVSSDVLGTLLISALRSSRQAILDKFPRAGEAEKRHDEKEAGDRIVRCPDCEGERPAREMTEVAASDTEG